MRPIRSALLVLCLALLPLSGCGIANVGSMFETPRSVKPGVVDVGEAVKILSAYRRSRGLGPVVVDSKLMQIAAVHARKMASLDRVDHVLPGERSFPARMSAGGYDASVAAENIGAGYDNLAEAFAGWRKSPHHNDNLLKPGVTEIGIALATAPDTKFGTYWSLVLASPYRPAMEGPSSGPSGVISFGQ
jgi:hypothetical protein